MPAIVILALLVAGVWGLAHVFVRRLVAWRPRRRIARVIRRGPGDITFVRSDFTAAPGEFEIALPGGSARVGDPVDDDTSADSTGGAATVTRPILTTSGAVTAGAVTWSPDPAPIAGAKDVVIPSAAPIPAWEFAPAAQRSRSAGRAPQKPVSPGLTSDSDCVVLEGEAWAIHVHGVRSSRRNALWGVPPAANAGFRSLVIAYRGAPDGPPAGRQAGMGYVEADDVEAAVEYAVSRGARRIVLVGWSMGASACLLAAERPAVRDHISGLVLVAPALSWRHIMRAGAARMHLAAWITRAVEALVQSHAARLAGMPAPVDLDALDWVTPAGRLGHPALVIGSRGDTNAPFALVERFAAANPDLVTVHEVAACRHGWEPNTDPEGFRAAVEGWMRRVA
ncbi:alpha/beta hydrolase family protein [Microbacterium karelineae]|uniref:alpha/beta hydrolase family protein n=1 Tax=Microbacterium karelineae TaxID=2654283 RepID=UPI0012E9FF2D|nr:alpha/beta fold hydrolase [Microbacterium karelineae]